MEVVMSVGIGLLSAASSLLILSGDGELRSDWDELGRTRDPVSYTHLDVYKRQALGLAFLIIPLMEIYKAVMRRVEKNQD